MKYYHNIEDDSILNELELYALFEQMAKEDPENFGQGFDYFLECATSENGSLREVTTRLFKDTENGFLILEEDLKREFDCLKDEDPETYNYSFNAYIDNCLSKNGFLEEVIK